MADEKKRDLYAAYSEVGYKIKVYDYPVMQTASKKRYQLDGEGIRYELVAFTRAIERGRAISNIDQNVSFAISNVTTLRDPPSPQGQFILPVESL